MRRYYRGWAEYFLRSTTSAFTLRVSARLKVLAATAEELKAHEARLAAIKKKSKDGCMWENIDV
jgi:hypothetical protein